MTVQCDTCGRFLAFADLCFAEFHFTPLNEFGPEETSWTGPCCRYRERIEARRAETPRGSVGDESRVSAGNLAQPLSQEQSQ